MLAICSATQVSMVQTLSAKKVLRKWEFLKNDFLPQDDVLPKYFLFLVKTMIYTKHNLANSTFFGIKDTQIWPEKYVNLLEAKIVLIIPHRQWIPVGKCEFLDCILLKII